MSVKNSFFFKDIENLTFIIIRYQWSNKYRYFLYLYITPPLQPHVDFIRHSLSFIISMSHLNRSRYGTKVTLSLYPVPVEAFKSLDCFLTSPLAFTPFPVVKIGLFLEQNKSVFNLLNTILLLFYFKCIKVFSLLILLTKKKKKTVLYFNFNNTFCFQSQTRTTSFIFFYKKISYSYDGTKQNFSVL